MTPSACDEIERMVRASLDSAIRVTEVENGCEVTLPILDQLNDQLRIYVLREGRRLVLTDYGTTIDRLRDLGMDISTPRQAGVLEGIITSNGIEDRNGVLLSVIEASDLQDFNRRLRLYAHAVSQVGSMEILVEARLAVDFEEVVYEYLRGRKIPCDHAVPVPAHRIGKVLVHFRLGENVLMDAAKARDATAAGQTLNRIVVDFENIQRVNSKRFEYGVVYDDESAIASSPRFKLLSDVLTIDPIPWTQRDERFDRFVSHRGRG